MHLSYEGELEAMRFVHEIMSRVQSGLLFHLPLLSFNVIITFSPLGGGGDAGPIRCFIIYIDMTLASGWLLCKGLKQLDRYLQDPLRSQILRIRLLRSCIVSRVGSNFGRFLASINLAPAPPPPKKKKNQKGQPLVSAK
jgi:hypothetical protein